MVSNYLDHYFFKSCQLFNQLYRETLKIEKALDFTRAFYKNTMLIFTITYAFSYNTTFPMNNDISLVTFG